VVEILKQPQFQPLSVDLQVASIFAVTQGKLDDIPVGDVRRFERELHDFLGSRYGSLLDTLKTSKLNDDLKTQLGDAIDAFRQTFNPSEQPEVEEANEGWDAMSATSEEA
jgi:F-type H+/Na+-transporting ATPase subunit alpha